MEANLLQRNLNLNSSYPPFNKVSFFDDQHQYQVQDQEVSSNHEASSFTMNLDATSSNQIIMSTNTNYHMDYNYNYNYNYHDTGSITNTSDYASSSHSKDPLDIDTRINIIQLIQENQTAQLDLLTDQINRQDSNTNFKVRALQNHLNTQVQALQEETRRDMNLMKQELGNQVVYIGEKTGARIDELTRIIEMNNGTTISFIEESMKELDAHRLEDFHTLQNGHLEHRTRIQELELKVESFLIKENNAPKIKPRTGVSATSISDTVSSRTRSSFVSGSGNTFDSTSVPNFSANFSTAPMSSPVSRSKRKTFSEFGQQGQVSDRTDCTYCKTSYATKYINKHLKKHCSAARKAKKLKK